MPFSSLLFPAKETLPDSRDVHQQQQHHSQTGSLSGRQRSAEDFEILTRSDGAIKRSGSNGAAQEPPNYSRPQSAESTSAGDPKASSPNHRPSHTQFQSHRKSTEILHNSDSGHSSSSSSKTPSTPPNTAVQHSSSSPVFVPIRSSSRDDDYFVFDDYSHNLPIEHPYSHYDHEERAMAAPKDIVGGIAQSFQNTLSISASPTSTFHSPTGSFMNRYHASNVSAKHLRPFNTKDIKILLLENVNQTAIDILNREGYQVEFHKSSLPEDELIEKIKDVHAIGIRSKTKLTAKVLSHAKQLIVIGCFCIGTNQVDLDAAAKQGVVVFNSPFSNSRSVAELVICEIIALARQLCDRSNELHRGTWNKVSNKCWEIRQKTLGIIGYGHIGSQLSVLAEAMGMTVIYSDVIPLMALGTAKQVPLDTLLAQADFVTLHVPELPETKNMISKEQLDKMKIGSYLINASRGSVVDIPALIDAMRSGRIAGAALDVYPHEPAANGDYFNNHLNLWAEDLRSLKNLILTPHIGGSTEEAQSAIGVEVGEALVRYINQGSTLGAVNFPEVTLRTLTSDEENHARVIFIHMNRPGVLRQVNNVLGEHNVDKQMSDSRGEVAYLMADISDCTEEDVKKIYEELEQIPARIVTRILY